MVDYVDPYFAPDIDSAWKVSPGALTSVTAFAPLQSGAYGSIGTANALGSATLTGTDHLWAKAFRSVAGTVRFLTFRLNDIDEYGKTGTRTNRGTGYTTATQWDAAAWGDQIIATNFVDAPQSSTGAGFTALGGSPPKARFIAANINFVMLYDVNDGGSNVFPDMVWWSGIRNPTTWAASQAKQSGYIRLLDAPGPGRGLVAFRDMFVAFKDNAFFIGRYIGPPKVFSWKLASAKVGCIAPKSICELDGRLYWLHSSGFWEFDGTNLRNVGTPIFQSVLSLNNYATGFTGDTFPPLVGYTDFDISTATSAVDDIEGVVWFAAAAKDAGTSQAIGAYGYNPRSGKWGRYTHSFASGGGSRSPLVSATSADMQAFFSAAADTAGRFWWVWNTLSNVATVRSMRYPAITTGDQASFTTGVYGDQQQSARTDKFYLRHRKGSSALVAAEVTASFTSYQNEDQLTSLGAVSGVYSPDFNVVHGQQDARYQVATVTYADEKKIILAGIAPSVKASGKR